MSFISVGKTSATISSNIVSVPFLFLVLLGFQLHVCRIHHYILYLCSPSFCLFVLHFRYYFWCVLLLTNSHISCDVVSTLLLYLFTEYIISGVSFFFSFMIPTFFQINVLSKNTISSVLPKFPILPFIFLNIISKFILKFTSFKSNI